jgi:transketolase
MVHHANASHVGSCLSIAEIVACLYWDTLRIDPERPELKERDRFLLSKGHAGAIVYAALARRGFFPASELETYSDFGSLLTGHISHELPGVEFSSGSLGHGLPVGCGIALAAKRERLPFRTVVLASDGELDEGSNWEAILFAPQHRLDNLLLIVDANEIQSLGNVKDVLDLDPLAEKFRAFRWAWREVDGHDIEQLRDAFASTPFQPGRPSVVIAHTVKGKGVSYMENKLAWHYKSPNAQQLDAALEELGWAK